MAPTPEANIRFEFSYLKQMDASTPIEDIYARIFGICNELENVKDKNFEPIHNFVKLTHRIFYLKGIDAQIEFNELIKQFPALSSWVRPVINEANTFAQAAEQCFEDKQSIANFVKSRDIQRLIHFTDLNNLLSITNHGLKSRNQLDLASIKYRTYDASRFDGLLNGICVSISEPNNAMVVSRFRNVGYKLLVIIELDPKLLEQKPFLAFPTNAASAESNSLLASSLNGFIGFNGLQILFKDGRQRTKYGAKPIHRDFFKLPDNVATDPQAEVIFYRDIDTSFIQKIHVPAAAKEYLKLNRDQLLANIPGHKWHVDCDWTCFSKFETFEWQDRNLDPASVLKGD